MKSEAVGTKPAKKLGRRAGAPPTRDEILDAAAELFAELGYEGAAMSAIAERARLTTGAIYRHFRSKEDLLLHVTRRAIYAEQLANSLRDGKLETTRELARMISTYALPDMRQARRLAIEIQSAAVRNEEAAVLFTKLVGGVREGIQRFLEERITRGDLPDTLDVPKATSLLLVLNMGLTHLDTLEPSRLGDSDWIEFFEESVVRLLADPPIRGREGS